MGLLLYTIFSTPACILIIILLAAALSDKKKELLATKAECDARIHNMNVDCQQRIQAIKKSASDEQIELFHKVRAGMNLGRTEEGWLYEAVTKPTEPDLSEGVVYICRTLDGTKYHHMQQCTPDAILVSKVFAKKLGLTACGCCDVNPQPQHDPIVTVSDFGRTVYHQGRGYCAGNIYYKTIPLTKAKADGLRPCSRCTPISDLPKVWF